MAPPFPLDPALRAAAATAAARSAKAEDARARLLSAGLSLFAAHGYSKTSTRELAEAAQVNIASISYYFGDKAGLYRAVFFEPMGGDGAAQADEIERFSDPRLPLKQALRAFYESFLAPLKVGESARLCMKLRFRELLEPTGLWEEEIAHGIRPMHEALLGLVCRHFGLPRNTAAADADLQRLAICLAGLGVHLHVGNDINEQLAPGLLSGPASIDEWADRLAFFGHALVQAEGARRGLRLAK